MPSREPHDVTHAIWSSWQLQHEDYAAQDFLVYIGKRMDPVDPQLDFMIPWFELGGMKEDLDTVLRFRECRGERFLRHALPVGQGYVLAGD